MQGGRLLILRISTLIPPQEVWISETTLVRSSGRCHKTVWPERESNIRWICLGENEKRNLVAVTSRIACTIVVRSKIEQDGIQ